MAKPKTSAHLTENLFSSNNEIVLKTINTVRDNGNVEYLPFLFKLLESNTDKIVKNSVYELLCDIKKESAVPFFIEALNSISDTENKKLLVSACWQSGLSFDNYLEIFIDILINDKLELAIEAFSVIENGQNDFSVFEIEESLEKLSADFYEISDVKKPLISELINILNNAL